jgi:hypothetical protein
MLEELLVITGGTVPSRKRVAAKAGVKSAARVKAKRRRK